MVKAFILGLLASLFFAFTFVLNKQMDLAGGSFLWSASLRYLFMFLILLVCIILKKEFFKIIHVIKNNFYQWIIWSTVGFGFFYLPLCYASAFGSPWLVASSWQVTIVAGALITPLFSHSVVSAHGVIKTRNKIPKKTLFLSFIILLGIILVQSDEINNSESYTNFTLIIPVIVAAFSYPLGNRKVIELNHGQLNTIQRVFAMTLCSMPFWVLVSMFALTSQGLPNSDQVFQSCTVALFSGVLATLLFFKATDLVSSSSKNLAIIESTQAGEVIFTLVGSILFLGSDIPSLQGFIGICIVICGMIINCMAVDLSAIAKNILNFIKSKIAIALRYLDVQKE